MWVPRNAGRIPNAARVHLMRRPGNRGVGYGISGVGYMYNKNLVKEPPTSWTDLWNPKWRGKVTFFDNNFIPLVLAARLNGGDEKNIDPGFKTCMDNAKNIRALANSNDQLPYSCDGRADRAVHQHLEVLGNGRHRSASVPRKAWRFPSTADRRGARSRSCGGRNHQRTAHPENNGRYGA
jgi:hypothetical protein